MSPEFDELLSDENLHRWAERLRDLGKAELERKEAAILHALETKRKQNEANSRPAEEGTEQLTTQLEVCLNQIAECALETQVIAVMPGAQPFGLERPRWVADVKCILCPLTREAYAPSGDLMSLSEESRRRFIARVSEQISENLQSDHQHMERHAKALNLRILLRA